MKRGTPDHPKTVDLASRLNIPRYQAVGILECLWHFTAEFAPQGNVGKFSDAAIAGHLHWDKPCRELITALCEAKYLERHPKHRLIVHDWHEHADQTVKRYLAKHGLEFVKSEQVTRKPRASTKLANASTKLAQTSEGNEVDGQPLPLPLPLPLPEPLPQPATCACAPSAADMNGQTSNRFDEFWLKWPRKASKDAAAMAWTSYVTVENEDKVFACLDRFLESGDVARGAVPFAGPSRDKPGWLADCARDDWECDWPRAREQATGAHQKDFVSDVSRTIGERLANGEKPWA